MVVQSGFLVALLACEAVAFAGEAAEAGLAVRRVLLAVDPAAGLVDDEAATAEVVPEVEFERWARVIREGGADAEQRDIHHVEAVVLLYPAALDDAVVLEEAVDAHRDVHAAALPPD